MRMVNICLDIYLGTNSQINYFDCNYIMKYTNYSNYRPIFFALNRVLCTLILYHLKILLIFFLISFNAHIIVTHSTTVHYYTVLLYRLTEEQL